MFFSKKNRSRLVYLLAFLFIFDGLFVRKIHPMQAVLSTVSRVFSTCSRAAAHPFGLWARLIAAQSTAIVFHRISCLLHRVEKENKEKSQHQKEEYVIPKISTDARESAHPEVVSLPVDTSVCMQDAVVVPEVQVSVPLIPEICKPEPYCPEKVLPTVTIDWNKAAERSVLEARRVYQAREREWQNMCAKYAPPTVYSNDQYTMAIDTPRGTAYLTVEPYVPCSAQIRHEQELDRIDRRYAYEPGFANAVAETTSAFIYNGGQIISGAISDRVLACLKIGEFAMPDPFIAHNLTDAQIDLWYACFHKDGSLCLHAVRTNTHDAHAIIKKYAENSLNQVGMAHYKSFFEATLPKECNGDRCTNQFHRSWAPSTWRKKWAIPSDFAHMIRTHPFNEKIKSMVHDFACGDLESAENIKKSYKNSMVDTLFSLCQAEYRSQVEAYKKSLQDAYGVYRSNDPLYLGLSEQEKVNLSKNRRNREKFNQLLLTRNAFKKSLQEAWDISHYASSAVHEALYKLLGNASAIGDVPLCIDQSIEMCNDSKHSVSDRSELRKAFFGDNGVHKVLASYAQAKNLKMPSPILWPEYGQVRRALNHFLYSQQTAQNNEVRALAARGIQEIQQAFALTDAHQRASVLYDSFVGLCHQVHTLQNNTLAPILDDIVSKCNSDFALDLPHIDGCGTGKLLPSDPPKGTCGSGSLGDRIFGAEPIARPCFPSRGHENPEHHSICPPDTTKAEPKTTCNGGSQTLPGFKGGAVSDAIDCDEIIGEPAQGAIIPDVAIGSEGNVDTPVLEELEDILPSKILEIADPKGEVLGIESENDSISAPDDLQVLTAALIKVKHAHESGCVEKNAKRADADMWFKRGQAYAAHFERLKLEKITKAFCKHTNNKHMPGGEKAIPGKSSIFNEGENFIEIAIETYEKGREIEKGKKIFDFGRIIGIAQDGTPTSKVEVCLNKTFNNFRTVYPVKEDF